MAKLIAVCREDEYPFDRRQIPLMIEESLTMVMEIPETIISAEYVGSSDVSQFTKKYSCLTQNEMNSALMVKQKELFSLLAVSVPCVGCRRSVERLYTQLWKSGQPAIEPLVITASGILTMTENFLFDAKLIYTLFYVHGSHLNDVVDTIPKSRRNRRCILHSLETHKTRASGSWIDVWDLLSQECRDEVVLIDSDSLLTTLDNYLRKHRFCSECKSKVLKAYSILSGDVDGDTEKGYCAGLYEGLKSCPKERHIHVVCDTDFIAHLIGRAEPELAGGRRERHARTIDIAQEEVLTCLGIHLWERLHRLWQKLRAEEQTWQMLFYLGVEALRKSFELAIEDKQGISQLELVVEEISEAERAKEQRKENKRMKKKKRKENKAKDKLPLEEEKEEEKSASDIDEKSTQDSESLDGSEKSSNDSQVSPRKVEEAEEAEERGCLLAEESCTLIPSTTAPCTTSIKRPSCQNNPINTSLLKACSDCEVVPSPQKTAKSNNVCKCDEPIPTTHKRNGYHDYCNHGYKPSNGKRNGHVNCRDCRSNKNEWKSDVYDKCCAISPVAGRGRVKQRKGGKQKDHYHDLQPSHNCHHRDGELTEEHSPSHHYPVVEDADELRLLKMMGWSTEDSTGITEKEIQDYVENRREMQTRRQELRDHLRAQFNKLSVNPLHVIPAAGAQMI